MNSSRTIQIETISDLGKGLTLENNKKIFVAKTAPHDQVQIEITKENNKLILANLVKIIKESEFRIPAPCPYFVHCGGCELQHLEENFYRQFKERILRNALSRSNIKLNQQIDWVFVGKASRRRVNFHIDKNNKIGFYQEGSNSLVTISNCLMLEKDLSDLILPLQKFLENLTQNSVQQISATKFDNGINIIFHFGNFILTSKLNEKLISFAKEHKLLGLSVKIKGDLSPIYQASKPQLIFDEVKINPPVEIFLQATKLGAEAISKEICNFVKNNKEQIKQIADLYSGIGAYSFSLAQFGKIDAFEGEEIMATSINQNAAQNNLSEKIKAFARDLVKNPLLPNELKKYDLVLINPPRNGAKSATENLAKSNVKNIIMISCNPQTFAIDAKILIDSGYKITKITAIDQFYYTHHLEVVATFEYF